MFDPAGLPREERAKCVFCDHAKPYCVDKTAVVSGFQTLIGKNRQKNDLHIKEPRMTHGAPVCHECREKRVAKIRRMRPLNCLLCILCWPAGIALIIGGIVLAMQGGIEIGNYRIVPYLFVFIACIPGILVLVAAFSTGKRGFSKPEKTYMSDAEEKLKKQVLGELNERDGGKWKGKVFAATMKETAGIEKQNTAAYAACKFPVAPPPPLGPVLPQGQQPAPPGPPR